MAHHQQVPADIYMYIYTPSKVKNDITSSSPFLVFWAFLGTRLPNLDIFPKKGVLGKFPNARCKF